MFDESTSNLDAHTEQAITQELEHLLKGKTAIFCAHRLSSIINVDKIHVVADGRLVEQGTHRDLVADTSSKYHLMWNDYMQKKKEGDKTAKKAEDDDDETLVDPAEKNVA